MFDLVDKRIKLDSSRLFILILQICFVLIPFCTMKKYKKGFKGTPRWMMGTRDAQGQKVNNALNSSIEKIRVNQECFDDYGKNDIIYDLMDMTAVFKNITESVLCGRCGTKSLTFGARKRVGLAADFVLECVHQHESGESCGYHVSWRNSESREYKFDGKFFILKSSSLLTVRLTHFYASLLDTSARIETINLALVNASRSAGIGHEATNRLCALLNMNNTPNNWTAHQVVLRDAYRIEAENSMNKAIKQAQQDTDGSGLTASLDGSWMKRGFASLNGLVSAISPSNKVIGVDVTAKYCQTCKGKGPCKKGDQCSINYKGSSGGMEPVGATNIIRGIFDKTGAKVTHYLGDGDSKGFVKAKCAVDWPMTKLECANHVAKRLGTRLRALRKKYELGGRGKLTNQAIDRMQQHYNNIIHSSQGDAQLMKAKVNSMRKHIGSSDGEPDHDDCDGHLCKYLQSYVGGKPYYHDDHFHISKSIMTIGH